MESDEDLETNFTIRKKVKGDDNTNTNLVEPNPSGENEMEKEEMGDLETEVPEPQGYEEREMKEEKKEDGEIQEEEESYKNPLWGTGEKEEEKGEAFDISKVQAAERSHGAFYDEKGIMESYQRRELETIMLRNYHNWIKSVLINKYTDEVKKNFRENHRGYLKISVLDLGCGTGGDITKWVPNRISYYLGVDVSKTAVEKAHERWEKVAKNRGLPADFINVGGAAKEASFYRNIDDHIYFDLVSSQFVIHYMFSKQSDVENLFNNISKRLCKGGYFICSIPDADVMVKRIRAKGVKNENDEFVLGNKFYSIKFKDDHFPKDRPYGIEYGFFLDDGAVGTKTIDEKGNIKITYVPEYVIIPENFKKVAKKYDLELVEEKNFHDFCKESIKNKNYVALMERLKLDDISKIPKELWEISYLYKVCAFRKTSGKEQTETDRRFDKYSKGKVIIQAEEEDSESSFSVGGGHDEAKVEEIPEDLFGDDDS